MCPLSLVILLGFFLAATISSFLLAQKKGRPAIPAAKMSQLFLFLSMSLVLILLWDGRFLVSSNIGFLDWRKEIYFFHFLRSSLTEYGELPLSFVFLPKSVSAYPTLSKSLSYWANPEVLTFSPFLILLPFLSTVAFLKTYFFLHLVIGAIGIFLLSKRLGFGLEEGLIFFVLTILNPWVVQHLAIGYTPWIQFCILPLIVAMLMNHRMGIKELIVASGMNALVIYGGGLHIFLWFNGTIAVFCLIHALRRKTLRLLSKVSLFYLLTGLLVLPKVIAVLAVFRGWNRKILGSYSSLSDLWGLLTDTNAPLYSFPLSYNIYGVNLYDGSIITGRWFIVLLALCIVVSVYRFFQSKKEKSRNLFQFPSFEVVVTALIFILLGWKGIWATLTNIVPLLSVEKYPWRFLGPAVFLLITFVIWECSRLTKTVGRPTFRRVFIILLFVPTIFSMYARNQLFVNAATKQPDTLAGFSLRSAFDRYGILPNTKSTPNRIIIYPTTDGQVSLPWLDRSFLSDFRIKNGQLVDSTGSKGANLRFIDKTQPIVIRPKDFYATPLIILALFAFMGVIYLVWRRKEENERAAQPSYAVNWLSSTQDR